MRDTRSAWKGLPKIKSGTANSLRKQTDRPEKLETQRAQVQCAVLFAAAAGLQGYRRPRDMSRCNAEKTSQRYNQAYEVGVAQRTHEHISGQNGRHFPARRYTSFYFGAAIELPSVPTAVSSCDQA